MHLIWPSTVVPSLASVHRHLTSRKTHLVPPHARGLFLTTEVSADQLGHRAHRRHLTFSTHEAFGPDDLLARVDTTLFTPGDLAWPSGTTLRLSPAFLDHTLPLLRGHGEAEFHLHLDPKTDSEALQVITVRRHDDVLVAKFAAPGFVTVPETHPSIEVSLPLDASRLSDHVPVTPEFAGGVPGAGPARLRRFAYRDARFATARDDAHSLLLGRWDRGGVTTSARTRILE